MDQKLNGLSHEMIIHPGETLQEIIEDNEMSQKELAIRAGVSEKHISTILSGQKSISVAFAKKLEYALGIEADFWINLQSNYDKEMQEYQEYNGITCEELEVLNGMKEILEDYRSNGYISSNIGNQGTIMELRHIFNISNLNDIPHLHQVGAFKIQNRNTKVNDYVLFAWKKMCELKEEKIKEQFNRNKLIENLPLIKKTMFIESNKVITELKKLFAECGIVFVVEKNYRGAPVHGYIQKKNNGQISLYVTIRQKYADVFWFTIFHEIGHIINGDFKNIFWDFDEMPDELEDKANKFAEDCLIDRSKYEKFIKGFDGSIASILYFAQENKVPDYIVYGRLMKDGIRPWGTYPRKEYYLIEK